MKINGSKVVRVFRVLDGRGRLVVTEDRKVWHGESVAQSHFSHVATLPNDARMNRDGVCRAANCWFAC